MPAVGLGGRRPLQDRAKVGGGWGRVLARGWVMRLVMIPKTLRQAQGERGWGAVFFFVPCRGFRFLPKAFPGFEPSPAKPEGTTVLS